MRRTELDNPGIQDIKQGGAYSDTKVYLQNLRHGTFSSSRLMVRNVACKKLKANVFGVISRHDSFELVTLDP